MASIPQNAVTDEAAIRAAREFSNKSIARRNLAGVGESLELDYVAVIGDGSFVASRAEYLKLFKQGFDSPKTALRYERIADVVEVAEDGLLAAERGHWIANNAGGVVEYTGSYMAMWRRGRDGWKMRTELFVTLTSASSG